LTNLTIFAGFQSLIYSYNKFEKKPICNSCYREYLENKLTKIKKDKKWSIITVCTLGITGLPLVFSFMEDTPEQKLAKEIERVRSENDRNYAPAPASSISSNLLFILLLSAVVFPIFFLIHLVKLFTYRAKEDKVRLEIE